MKIAIIIKILQKLCYIISILDDSFEEEPEELSVTENDNCILANEKEAAKTSQKDLHGQNSNENSETITVDPDDLDDQVNNLEQPSKNVSKSENSGTKINNESENDSDNQQEPIFAKYNCPLCNKSFDGSSNLKKHIQKIHKKLQKYQCEKCGELFTPKRLKMHIEEFHESEDFDIISHPYFGIC